MQNVNFAPSIRRIGRVLLTLVAFFGLITVPMQLAEYRLRSVSWSLSDLARRFTVDSENSVPAWYSSNLLLAAAVLLAVTAAVAFHQRDRWWKHWAALASLFCLLSLDEAASFHEAFILPMQRHFGAHGIFFFAWVIPGAIFVMLVGLAFLKFVWNLDRATRSRFITAGAIFVGGALGLEFVGGAFMDSLGEESILYILTAAVEETCEMFGVTLFIIAILQHLETRVGEFRVSFKGSSASGTAAVNPAG